MPTTIIRLLGFDGPNLYGPQPGVFLQVSANKDYGPRMRNALKDGALSVGMVVGYLDVTSKARAEGYLISVSFTTPTPAIGVELARYVVAGLNARESNDEDWDAEGLLWDLQKRRRAEALPLAALQLVAEASSRGIPTMFCQDGQLQIGYGARSWAFDPAAAKPSADATAIAPGDVGVGAPPFARSPHTIAAPWDRLGPIPIIAVSGGANCDSAARLIAAILRAHGQSTGFADRADYQATQALLADQNAMIAVAGLAADGIATRGLAFDRCAYSAVTDLPDSLPIAVADHEELARVLGVPMLVTDQAGRVALNADIPAIAALAEYAPCPVVFVSATSTNSTVAFHCASGGAALFVRDEIVIAASGASEQPIVAATLPPTEMPGALAALAILWSMGLTWEQILAVNG